MLIKLKLQNWCNNIIINTTYNKDRDSQKNIRKLTEIYIGVCYMKHFEISTWHDYFDQVWSKSKDIHTWQRWQKYLNDKFNIKLFIIHE